VWFAPGDDAHDSARVDVLRAPLLVSLCTVALSWRSTTARLEPQLPSGESHDVMQGSNQGHRD